MSTNRELRVVIVGAGMAGILAAVKLREAGIENIVVYEKADRIGGTWRENTYPGLTCDVPAHSYTYSFEPSPDWSSYLAPGGEIQAYFERVVKKYGLGEVIRFNQELARCEFSEGQWHLEMKNGLKDSADFVIAATGVLHYINYPDIPGLASFRGALMHSAKWDHSVPLEGKRIGIIGNGSTGVQIVSALAGKAKLKHFQRSAQWIMPVQNKPYSEEQKRAFAQDKELLKNMQTEETYVKAVMRFTDAITDAESEGIQELQAIVTANLEDSVTDPELRERLRPDYLVACKRLVYSPDYYKAIQHPDSELVTDYIECVEPGGVRTRDGKFHELDVLVLATGYEVGPFIRPAEVIGRDGVKLNDVWESGPTAYMAISIPDFPNFAMLNGPTGPVGNFSLIDIAEHQWGYIEQLIELVRSGQCSEVSASAQALDQYNEARVEAARHTVFASGCTSWYIGADGVPITWPWSYDRFIEEMAEPQMDAYDLL